MTAAMIAPTNDEYRPPRAPRAPENVRKDRRRRTEARIEAAVRCQPSLRVDRVTPLLDLLRTYRAGCFDPFAFTVQSPLGDYIAAVAREVDDLESHAAAIPRRTQLDGATTRRALCFLKTFGRVSALDFEVVPTEERDRLVHLLKLEYRWCFAAAGTTPRAFKIAIGRTGAR